MARASTNGSTNEISTDDLHEQIESLRADIAAITASLSDMARGRADKLAERAAEKADVLHEKGAEAARVAADRAREAHAKTEDFLRTQPATALGIAAGLGFLVGLMSARK